MPLVSTTDIERASKTALQAYGAKDWIATSVARAIADAESYGNVICGLYYLESYCLQLATGRVNGTVDPQVSASRPGSILSDAQFGFAQSAFAAALPAAIVATRENGTASLSVAHAHTCTSLGYFTSQLAAEGLLAIGFTNASPVVAPPGGSQKVIGTNPIAMSVPDGQGGLAVHFDFSTSAVALGKITMAKAAGRAIPLGWAVDSQGEPTTDPDAALSGALVSAGGYRGWGFGILAELLAAGITGSVNSLDVGGLKLPEGAPHGLGQFYFMIDPSTHHVGFADRLARLVDSVALQEGARLPGSKREPLEEVDVPDALWDAVGVLGCGPVRPFASAPHPPSSTKFR
jgi:(2R)-3-sulfolactate dehydrogenase (NADP+)